MNGLHLTLTSDRYTDPNVLAKEKEKIFFKEWLFIGHLCEFENEGAYVSRSILDQQIFVIRGKDGALRGFYNVCAHRGHELVKGSGIAKTLVCGYHNWSYFTDGKLKVAPNSKNVAGFERDRICLTPIRIELCGQFVFVNLDPEAAPLKEKVGVLAAEIQTEYPDITATDLKMIDESSWGVQANWKVDIENFLECYHCAPAHSLFGSVFEVSSQRAILNEHYVFHYAEPKPIDKAGYVYDPEAYPKRLATWTIFPNTMIYLFPGKPTIGVMVASPHPTDPNQSVFWAKAYATDAESAMAPDLFHIMDVTMNEDIEIIESVQRGMRSKGFERGALLIDADLSEKSEHTIYHFQQYIMRQLEA